MKYYKLKYYQFQVAENTELELVNVLPEVDFDWFHVKGLLSMKDGAVLKTILDEFRRAGNFGGYDVEYKVLLASDYGVPQNRERVIIIGTRHDLGLKPRHPESLHLDHKVTVDEAISDLPQIKACEGLEVMNYPIKPQNEYQALMRQNMQYVTNHIAMHHTKRLIDRFEAIKPGQSLVDVWETHGSVKRGAPGEKSDVKFGQNNQRLWGNQPAPTIAASFQSNFIHPHLNRNFTAREGARLQSFPDDFIFEGMRTKMSWEKGLSQYQQIGNAVPVLMAVESIFPLTDSEKSIMALPNSTSWFPKVSMLIWLSEPNLLLRPNQALYDSRNAYILNTLVRLEYLNFSEDTKRYKLSRKLLTLGFRSLNEHNLLETVLPHLRDLRDQVKETACFGVLGDEKGIFIEQAQGHHTFRFVLSPGKPFELHCSAPGKAIMAYLPKTVRDRYLSYMTFTRYNSRTITSREAYLEELEKVGKLGYAMDNEEELSGVICVGAPIFNYTGYPCGAIWVYIDGTISKHQTLFGCLTAHQKYS